MRSIGRRGDDVEPGGRGGEDVGPGGRGGDVSLGGHVVLIPCIVKEDVVTVTVTVMPHGTGALAIA